MVCGARAPVGLGAANALAGNVVGDVRAASLMDASCGKELFRSGANWESESNLESRCGAMVMQNPRIASVTLQQDWTSVRRSVRHAWPGRECGRRRETPAP